MSELGLRAKEQLRQLYRCAYSVKHIAYDDLELTELQDRLVGLGDKITDCTDELASLIAALTRHSELANNRNKNAEWLEEI